MEKKTEGRIATLPSDVPFCPVWPFTGDDGTFYHLNVTDGTTGHSTAVKNFLHLNNLIPIVSI